MGDGTQAWGNRSLPAQHGGRPQHQGQRKSSYSSSGRMESFLFIAKFSIIPVILIFITDFKPYRRICYVLYLSSDESTPPQSQNCNSSFDLSQFSSIVTCPRQAHAVV